MSELDIYTPEIIEEADNEPDSDVLGDGVNAADDSDGGAEDDSSPAVSLASPVLLSAAPLTAATTSNGSVWNITDLRDYAADEDPIPGTLRYILNNNAQTGDTINFSINLYQQDFVTVELKRALPTLAYSCNLIGGDSSGRHAVIKPAEGTTDVRLLPTLGTSTTANATWAYIDFTGFDYSGEQSAVRGALFSYYYGTLSFQSCGFYDNPSYGNMGLILLINRSGAEPKAIFYNCVFYNNGCAAGRTVNSGDVCSMSSSGSLTFSGCTAALPLSRAGYNIYAPNIEIESTNGLIRRYKDSTGGVGLDYSDEVHDYFGGDLRLYYNSIYATQNTKARIGYDRVVIPVGGPIGAYGSVYAPSISYLTKIFGDDDLVLQALAADNIPFLSKTEADAYFGETEDR